MKTNNTKNCTCIYPDVAFSSFPVASAIEQGQEDDQTLIIINNIATTLSKTKRTKRAHKWHYSPENVLLHN